jgi:hypothetical protein
MNKVIKIIDAYNILVSRDENFKNVRINSLLEIYSEGPEILYEDVNYGTLDLVKAELRVKGIFPKMLLCENNKYTKVKVIVENNKLALKENKTLLPENISKLIVSPIFQNKFYNTLEEPKIKEVEKIVPLNIDKDQIDDSIKLYENLIIRLGDLVRIKENYE